MFGASFQIGRSALAAYQAAISIVGQNVANVGNPDYTRQTGRLAAEAGGAPLGGTTMGGGVRLATLERHANEALERRLRMAMAQRAGAEETYNALTQIEALYNELSDEDLSSDLNELFSTFATLQTAPGDTSTRSLILAAAERISRTMLRQRETLLQQAVDLNDTTETAALRANALTQEIGSLNEQIVTEEAGGQVVSGALRDRRAALVRELSEVMDVLVREQDNGSLNIYIGSEPLVEFNRSRGLTVQRELSGGYERASVRFADNNGSVVIRDGRLAGLLEARDTHVAGQIERLDELARGLIYEVNRVHSGGRGLVGYTQTSGSYAVQDARAALNSSAANLTFPVENGTFIVNVQDCDSGRTITRQIEVDLDGLGTGDTTLTSLAAALNDVPGLTASVTTDSRLQLATDSGQELWFSEDTSGALAALGVANFFEGTNAATITVKSAVRDDPRLIAASLTGERGDGNNAGLLASIAETQSALLENQSIQDFHASTVNMLAVTTSGALSQHEAADAVYSGLFAQREAISGVSLDEEAINLAKFEKAYQGATRYLSVVDSLTNELMALV
ncbi:MAG: flagellar hook-associated protein FlgK [Planctomycetes bacterium]|nr:flagellar hook-associated protein FlgK [Planctomycetota bacterium]